MQPFIRTRVASAACPAGSADLQQWMQTVDAAGVCATHGSHVLTVLECILQTRTLHSPCSMTLRRRRQALRRSTWAPHNPMALQRRR